jgi:C_GCAxxG_C_C family probable redox protein
VQEREAGGTASYQVDRKELKRLAGASFDGLLNCAESTSKAVADHFNVGRCGFPRAATPFGGGIARGGGPCGAVTGTLMGIGLLYGRDAGGDHRNLDRVYAMVHELQEEFARRFGSTMCRDLLKCDISTNKGRIKAKKDRLFDKQCPDYVAGALDILADIVEREARGGYDGKD